MHRIFAALLALSLAPACALAADVRPVQSETVWGFEYEGGTFTALVTSTTGGALTSVAIETAPPAADAVAYAATTESDWFSVPAEVAGALDELAARTSASETTLAGIMPSDPTTWAIPVVAVGGAGLTQVDLGYYERDTETGRILFGHSGVSTAEQTYDYGLWLQASDSASGPAIGVSDSSGYTTFVELSSAGDGAVVSRFDLDMTGSSIVNLADPENDQDAATKAYVDEHAGGGGFAWTALEAGTDFVTTAKNASAVTMSTDQTTNIKAGMLVEITTDGTAYPYRVKAIASNLLTVQGPDLATGAGLITAIRWSSRTDAIGYIQFSVPGNWCDATDGTILETDAATYFRWPMPNARIVGAQAIERATTGSPVVNVTINGDNVLDTGLTVGTSWTDSEGNLSTNHSSVETGNTIQLACTAAVATGNTDLTVGIWYYVEGSAGQ